MPKCNSCEKEMVTRQNTKTGEYFWGCPNFPKCLNTVGFYKQMKAENSFWDDCHWDYIYCDNDGYYNFGYDSYD